MIHGYYGRHAQPTQLKPAWTISHQVREIDTGLLTETPERVVAIDVLRVTVDGPRCKRFSESSFEGGLRRADVTDRRRLCTTPCIFGNAALRTASAK